MTITSSAASLAAKKKLLAGALLGASLTLLSACDRQPEGQVVAVVNGDEVTQQEINLAIGDAQIPEGADEEQVRNTALANLINRRLIAEIAREEGIDATPEYIVRKQQVEEGLLVQLLTQKLGRDVIQPSPEDLDAFIADNPQMFAQRRLFSADQIRFVQPARQDYLEALAPATTMEQVVTVLNRLGIQFQRANTQIDSGNLDPDLFKKVVEVGTSEPIVVPAGRMVSVSKILGSQSAPLGGDEARSVAARTLGQRAVTSALEERLDQAKEEAGIDYQPGYGPLDENAGEGLTPSEGSDNAEGSASS